MFSSWIVTKWEGDFPADLQFMSEQEEKRLCVILLRVWVLSSCFHFSNIHIPTQYLSY